MSADAATRPSAEKPVAGLASSDQANGKAPQGTFLNYETVVTPSSQGQSTDAQSGEGSSKQKAAMLNVPRSGSQSNETQTPNTGLSGATAADAESIGRGSKHSKRSFMGKRRAESAASSGRSQQRAVTSEKTEQPPSTPTANRAGSTRSKTRKTGGFLACLPCFAPKESRVEGDQTPENAKQAQKVPTGRTSQSTPVKKQDVNAPAPISKELNEKAEAGSIRADKAANSDGTAERLSADNRPQIVTRSSSRRQAEQTSPPQPGTLQTGHPQINVTSPTPGTTPVMPSHTRPSVEQQRMIEDQTEDQKAIDTDIEMKDVPLSSKDVPHEGEEVTTDEQSEHPKVDLPPPPPLADRQIAVHDQRTDISEASDQQKYLLGPIAPRFKGKKCLVLDLDETLVHSSFKILHQADFTIPVEIEGQYHNVYVIKRPGVDQFMKRVGELYEVVVFTASVSKYGDPLLDQLDIHNVVHHRLFRESCYNHQGNYVKDLSQIGRDLKDTIIIDNSPTSYIFHPQHAVPISSWFSDAHDNELLDLIPVLEDLAGTQVSDVSLVLDVAL